MGISGRISRGRWDRDTDGRGEMGKRAMRHKCDSRMDKRHSTIQQPVLCHQEDKKQSSNSRDANLPGRGLYRGE
jgi:hypothetical protein